MMPEDEAFTTQAAANFLGVSRQHFVNLIEEGKIPYHKVGTHRRVYFRDLKEYSERRDKSRRESLDSLFDKVSKAGKHDSSYTGDES
jgi:excisionase family DNA binding protein